MGWLTGRLTDKMKREKRNSGLWCEISFTNGAWSFKVKPWCKKRKLQASKQSSGARLSSKAECQLCCLVSSMFEWFWLLNFWTSSVWNTCACHENVQLRPTRHDISWRGSASVPCQEYRRASYRKWCIRRYQECRFKGVVPRVLQDVTRVFLQKCRSKMFQELSHLGNVSFQKDPKGVLQILKSVTPRMSQSVDCMARYAKSVAEIWKRVFKHLQTV